MKIAMPDQWRPSDNIVLENAAEKSVRVTSNVLVVAGPGAGKTELLAQKAGYLFETNVCTYPQKILAISFKKDAADNLKKRVIRRYGNEVSSRFISLTYDAFAKSILDRFRLSLPKGNVPLADYIVNDDDIIDAAFKAAGFVPSNGQSYESVISSVVLPLQGDSLGVNVWRKLLLGFGDHRACLSFKMISMLAIHIVQSNRQIKKAMQLTYSHVFLDEFQDTTSLQYDLIKTCFLGSTCVLTAVGDEKQRIMLWAGARRTVFVDFCRDFHAEENRLIMNHRSAPRLVNLQRAMYDSLQDAQGQVEASPKWNPNDGEINLLIATNNQTERDYLISDIRGKIANGLNPNDICILCKQKPQDYTCCLIEGLAANRIRARIETDYQDLIKEPIVELVLSFLRLAVELKHPEDWTVLLDSICELRGIDNNANGSEDYYSLQEEVLSVIRQVDKGRKIVKTSQDIDALVSKIVGFLGVDRIKAHYIAYRQGNFLKDRLSKFVELFWIELGASNFDWNLAIDNFIGLNSIPIMTIHKSKGLEYSAVYFVGLEDSAFWNFRKQPEEDRCAFFVALSRAKQSVTFTYSDYRNGMKYPQQRRTQINEFFCLLQTPGMANIIEA